MAQDATNKRRKILFFIREFMRDRGYSPTFREVQAALEYKSVSGVNYQLLVLKADGLVTWDDNVRRTLRLTVAHV